MANFCERVVESHKAVTEVINLVGIRSRWSREGGNEGNFSSRVDVADEGEKSMTSDSSRGQIGSHVSKILVLVFLV
jgi:hypothetical protein